MKKSQRRQDNIDSRRSTHGACRPGTAGVNRSSSRNVLICTKPDSKVIGPKWPNQVLSPDKFARCKRQCSRVHQLGEALPLDRGPPGVAVSLDGAALVVWRALRPSIAAGNVFVAMQQIAPACMEHSMTCIDLNLRIASVEENLAILRQEIALLEDTNPAVARLHGIINVGARSLEGLRLQRDNLLEPPGS